MEEQHEKHIKTLRKSTRQCELVDRYSPPNFSCVFSLLCSNNELRSIRETFSLMQHVFWMEAMQDEMMSLDRYQTQDVVDLSKPVGCKQLLEKKFKVNEQLERSKAQLVINCYSKVEGLDLVKFSHVAKLISIGFILSIVISYDLEVQQIDVKFVYFHGDLEEEIHVKQPEGFVIKGKENLVCTLKWSLYGLKQLPQM